MTTFPIRIGAALLAAIGPVGAVEFGDATVSYNLSLASAYLFRGVSQTIDKPALQVGVDLSWDNGLYISAWTSNVDFAGDGAAEDGVNRELDLMVGYALDINDRLSLDVAWVRYHYPGAREGFDYDYDEWLAALFVGDSLELAAGYSPGVFGESEPGWYWETSKTFSLSGSLSLTTTLGHYDLARAYGRGYGYGSATLSWQWAGLGWSLGYHDTSRSAETLFSGAAKRRMLLQVEHRSD